MLKTSFSHVALLVPAVELSASFLQIQGIDTLEPECFESEGTKEVYVGEYNKNSGLLLLVEAIGKGPYERALNKRGPGLHHIAIDVLDLEDAISVAQDLGWKLHPISQETKVYHTAWLYLKGVPILIEVHQQDSLSSKPQLVSSIELPISTEHRPLFEGIGLGEFVQVSQEVHLTVAGRSFSLEEFLTADDL